MLVLISMFLLSVDCLVTCVILSYILDNATAGNIKRSLQTELFVRLSLEVCLVVTIKGHVRCLAVDDMKSSPKIVYSSTF